MKNHNSLNEISLGFGVNVLLGTTIQGVQVCSNRHYPSFSTRDEHRTGQNDSITFTLSCPVKQQNKSTSCDRAEQEHIENFYPVLLCGTLDLAQDRTDPDRKCCPVMNSDPK